MTDAKREYHHGKTPAAWAGSIIAAVGFAVGALGFVLGPNMALIYTGAVLLLVALIAGVVLRRMGYGQ
ncbi:MAG: HGxxPAAW family protein [Propionibacteriaceae bacterium]|nr:hypothetical protein [Micropruina sp.]HBX81266.1 hypothetical protein [Propionibacteriaceae bacterium]HBY22781.1 hypothetical protein [Propionibacteriaceae bacterium]